MCIRDSLGGMDLDPISDTLLFEHVQDGVPTPGEVLVSLFDLSEIVRGEGVEQVPDAGAGEAIDLMHTELSCGACGVRNFLSGALADAFGLTVTPHMIGHNAGVACIDAVSYTHLRAHETVLDLVCRLLLEKKKKKTSKKLQYHDIKLDTT